MLVTEQTSSSLSQVLATDDSMSDDVFESPEDLGRGGGGGGGGVGAALSAPGVVQIHSQPSPTGYRDYQPPANVLKLYERAEEEAEQTVHKTILLGDSGVGKTSLLVQFDTGKFQSGNFSATVGIGFTLACLGAPRGGRAPRRTMTSRKQQATSRRSWSDSRPREKGDQTARPSCPTLPSPQRPLPQACDFTCNVMLLGDSGVGKTCLLVRFRDGMFLSGNFISTVGIDFRNKVVMVEDSKVKLQIWDTAGQERFRSVTHAYYRDAHALLLLYDVTNKTSFDNIRAWLGEIREYAQDDVVIMLLGNKADCGSDRVVRKEDGERLAREYNVAFMETSAKTGMNVELTFMAVARQLKCRRSDDPDQTRFNVQDYVREQAQRGSCPPCTS